MKELISDCYRGEDMNTQLENDEFDMIGPDGSVILPRVWHSLVQPGFSVAIRMWSTPPSYISSETLHRREDQNRVSGNLEREWERERDERRQRERERDIEWEREREERRQRERRIDLEWEREREERRQRERRLDLQWEREREEGRYGNRGRNSEQARGDMERSQSQDHHQQRSTSRLQQPRNSQTSFRQGRDTCPPISLKLLRYLGCTD